MDEQLKRDMARLREWAKTLLNQIDSNMPEIERILTDGGPLPEGCPSPGSLAAMQFSYVTQAVEEVQAAVEDVYKGLFR